MSILSRNKRPLIALALAFSFIACGAFIITFGLINTGGLFFYTPIAILAYIPVYWFLEHKMTPEKLLAWKKKEIWGLTGWMLFLYGIGIIESLYYTKPSVFIFIVSLALLILFINKHLRLIELNTIKSIDYKNISIWIAGSVLSTLMALFVYASATEMTEKGTLVLLENDEDLIETLLSILVFVILFFMLSWLIWQVKSALQLKNDKKKTEVLHLQSQVNPHFFFNTLNNLYGLVSEDTEKAQALILKLSDMMRYSIYEGQRDRVSIAEEVAYLKNYVALHKMRYHKEIDIEFTTDIQDEHTQVMPLLFILLLENAFKHGVERLHTDASVAIHIQQIEQKIRFSIVNNYDTTQDAEAPGIGLKNLKRRLALVYPKKHTLSFDITKDVYKVQLIIHTQ
ncbi:MAG: two-component system sensor histidine kinase AlgZ [Dokdonia sp.]|jgi:two-component system sensor histidine kinase AlgZ